MANVLIVYATVYGNTKKVAEAVAKGAESVNGTKVTIKLAEEATAEDVVACDGLITGSPVHMGSPDWKIKQFIDNVCAKLWMKDKLVGKVGAVFACGGGFGSAGGGGEITMLAMLNNLAELGLLLVPLPKNTPGYGVGGLQWGPYSRTMGPNMEQTGVKDEMLEVARNHGANVARAAKTVKGQAIFTPLQKAAK